MSEAIPKDHTPFGPFRRVVARNFIWLILFIAIPVVPALLRSGSLANVNWLMQPGLPVAAYVLVMALLTRSRLNWGESLHFDGTLTVQRKGEPPLVLGRDEVQHARLNPGNAFSIAYSDAGKKRAIIIGSEGFTAENWAKLETEASAWIASGANAA